MKKFLLRLFFVLINLLFLTCSANAQEIKIYTEISPPFQIVDSNGKLTGITTEVVRAVLKQINITTKINIVPWARAIYYGDNEPNTLLFSMIRTPERENKYVWIGSINSF